MTTTSTLTRYRMYVGGEWIDAGSGDYFESDNPYLGEPWALIPRGTAADADRAVRAAHAAFTSGEWPRLTASRRGALLRRLGDLITQKSAALAEIEVRDNGKLYAEMSAQTAYMAQWYHYYGGLADKIEGAVLPTDKPETFNFTRYEPLGVVVAIIPWNSPLLLAGVEARAGTRGRQHRGGQAVGVHLGLRARVHETGGGGRVSLPASSTWSPASAPMSGLPLIEHPLVSKSGVHRIRRDRSARLRGRGARLEAREHGTRRQVAEHRVRRCGPRQRDQGRHLRHLRGDRPDVHRRVTPAGAAEHSRPVPREARRVCEDGAGWAIRWTRARRSAP